jgi:hypothetical protein
MSGPRQGRFPRLDPAREELLRAKWIWTGCCFAPIIYFVVARAVDVWCFGQSGQRGFMPLQAAALLLAARIFLLYLVALQAGLMVLRRWFDRRGRRLAADLKRLGALYLRRTIVLLAISESAVLGGLIYFLAFGDIKAVLIGGVASYLFYAQSYPSELGLARLAGIVR